MARDISEFEFDPAVLDGFTLEQLKCDACSGYGNCGYRMYKIKEGKPVLICQQKKKKLAALRDKERAQMGETAE